MKNIYLVIRTDLWLKLHITVVTIYSLTYLKVVQILQETNSLS